VGNPIDLIASVDARQYRECLRRLVASDEIDAVVAAFVPRIAGSERAIAEAVADVAEAEASANVASDVGKPLVALFMPSDENPAELTRGTRQIPCFAYPESVATALASAVRCAERRNIAAGQPAELSRAQQASARELHQRAMRRLGPDGGWLDPAETHALLGLLELPAPKWRVARSACQVVEFAEQVGGPVVLKVISPNVVHKSEAGGVAVGVSGEAEILAAYERVFRSAPDALGVLVQQYVISGIETFIGAVRDPAFGHLLMFGLGGVQAELLRDATVRMRPLTEFDAAEMVRRTRAGRLLAGYRGIGPGDVAAVQQVLLHLSALLGAVPEIAELDFNPVRVFAPGRGICVLDCRVRIGDDRRIPVSGA
jgi:acyl-CoA synthetase (NDP forming)